MANVYKVRYKIANESGVVMCFKVAALLMKPKIRLCAKKPTSECMSQSDECKNYFGTRLCVCAHRVSVYIL